MSPAVAEAFLQGFGLGFFVLGCIWGVQAGISIVRRFLS